MKTKSVAFNNKVFISGFTNQTTTLKKRDLNYIAILCSYIKQGDKSNVYEIDKSDLIRSFKLSKNSYYRELKLTLLRIQTFVFNISDRQPVNVRAVNLFKHINDFHSAFIRLEFDPDLHKLFTHIDPGVDQFTRIQVDQILIYKKLASKRLYIHLAPFQPGSVIVLSIDKLKDILDLHGKYKDTSDLIKRAIKPAVNEMFYSDLPVSISEIWDHDSAKKKGKKITGISIKLLIAKSKDPDSHINKVNDFLTAEKRNQLAGYLIGVLKVSKDQADHLINRVPLDEILKIGRTIEKAFSDSRNGTRNEDHRIRPEKYAAYTCSTFRKIYRSATGNLFSKKYIPLLPSLIQYHDSNNINKIGVPVTN